MYKNFLTTEEILLFRLVYLKKNLYFLSFFNTEQSFTVFHCQVRGVLFVLKLTFELLRVLIIVIEIYRGELNFPVTFAVCAGLG